MRLYYITDGKQLRDDPLGVIASALRAGVDLVQIREKHLSPKELLDLARAAAQLARGTQTRILVSTRLDVALAAGAHGVHLPAGSVSPAEIRRISPPGFVVGVSCHDPREVRQAASEGADFAVFGPVFDTPSKRAYGPPQGLKRLQKACQQAGLPVLALGGVEVGNAAKCIAAGAAGIAGISLFQQAADLAVVVAALRALPEPPAKR
jgi:thiamine-phosphate pyrophosphorylase